MNWSMVIWVAVIVGIFAVILCFVRRFEAGVTVGIIAIALAIFNRPIEIAWDHVFSTGSSSTAGSSAPAGGPSPSVILPSTAIPTKSTQPGPTPGSTTESTGPNVLRAGTFTLASRYSVDLDASSSDLQWGIGKGSAPGTPRDLEWTSSYGLGPSTWAHDTRLELLEGQQHEPSQCLSETGYSDTNVKPAQIDKDTYFCVKTAEGNYALLRVLSVDGDKRSIKMEATVIEG